MGITDIADDVRSECSKCGPVGKVIVYDVCVASEQGHVLPVLSTHAGVPCLHRGTRRALCRSSSAT